MCAVTHSIMSYGPDVSWYLGACCRTESLIKTGKVPAVTMVDAQKNYKKALEKGVLKILSKVRCASCAALCVQLWRSDMRLMRSSTWRV
jgi:hypothetical protein